MLTPSFITANYVARVKGYNGEANWGVHDNATVDASNRRHVEDVVRDVKAAGFRSIDIWMAHCHWKRHSREHLRDVREVCQNNGMTIASYAGGIHGSPAELEATFAFMADLGAPVLAGGYFGQMPTGEVMPLINDICGKYSVRYGLENHPEKTADEIWSRIDNGKHDGIGVALDTGWCATQNFDALDAVKRFREAGKLFILHLKDVTQPGGHDTCALGDGVIPCEQIVKYLKQSGWDGTICIEHEPYDRDPMPEVKTSLERVIAWLK